MRHCRGLYVRLTFSDLPLVFNTPPVTALPYSLGFWAADHLFPIAEIVCVTSTPPPCRCIPQRSETRADSYSFGLWSPLVVCSHRPDGGRAGKPDRNAVGLTTDRWCRSGADDGIRSAQFTHHRATSSLLLFCASLCGLYADEYVGRQGFNNWFSEAMGTPSK